MPSIYELKPAFQRLLRPSVRALARRGVTANQVTVVAAVISIATGALVALYPDRAWPFLLVPPILLLRMALNAIDGMLAREHAMASRLGAVLNELGDVLADSCLYLAFALSPSLSPTLVVLVATLAVISEMSGVVSVQIGASRRYDGPMGKSDRAFVFGALALCLGLGFAPQPWLDGALALAAAALILTIFNRARNALAEGC